MSRLSLAQVVQGFDVHPHDAIDGDGYTARLSMLRRVVNTLGIDMRLPIRDRMAFLGCENGVLFVRFKRYKNDPAIGFEKSGARDNAYWRKTFGILLLPENSK